MFVSAGFLSVGNVALVLIFVVGYLLFRHMRSKGKG